MNHERKFYVYVHRRKTDGRIFYVGKGYGTRHLSLSGRNRHWKNVALKNGWYAEIFKSGMSEPCAFSYEKSLIFSMRNLLTNVYPGGEGPSGFVHTDETKEKFRAAKLGKKQSPEHAAKSAVAKIGKKHGPKARESLRLRKSKPVVSSDGETFPSATEAARQMSARTGLSVNQGNISMCARGGRNSAYGLSWEYAA